MLPISDSPRDPAHRPWATLALIAANVAVGAVTLPLAFVAWEPASPLPGVPAGAELDQLYWVAYTFGARPSAPSLTTTLTAMFLHAGVLHLAGNMLYLWIYGPNVERRLGSVPFVLLYVTAGLLGTLLFTLVSLGSPRPSIGASGAISGVLGAYLVFFPVNTIRVLFYVFTVELPAFLVLMVFLVIDNILPFLFEHTTSVAHAAHLGGFFGGMVLAAGLRFLQPSWGRPRPKRVNPLARATSLLQQGMLIDAHEALTKLAGSADEEVATAARRHLDELEADPSYQRAARRG